MSDWSWPGSLLGLTAAVGVLLAVSGLPASRRATLQDRLAPYLRDAAPPSRLLTSAAFRQARFAPARVLERLVLELAGRLDRFLGGAPSVRRRQQRAGQAPDVAAFRAAQVLWGAGAGLAGVVLGLLASVTRGAAPLAVVLFVLACTTLGILARDQWLSRQARQREERMLAEFPTVAELLALAVSAGEGATGALDRVCRLSTGELSGELARCLADARAGASLPTALQGLADRTGLVSLARFVDGMVVAVERGTPLAEVLRSQAQDVREAGRRAVLESGGRKEIGMMIPVVFLVLPVTVVFAVFPGFAFLRVAI